jgi:uncharacterized protein (TIGR03435 family)
MMKLFSGVCLLTVYAFGQRFDAVTVRFAAGASNNPIVVSDPAIIEVQGIPFASVLSQAYDVGYQQISGPGAKEVSNVYLDYSAKIPEGESAKVPAMLQNMLHDKFGMEAHKEKQLVKAYALVLADPVLLKERGHNDMHHYQEWTDRQKQYMLLQDLPFAKIVRWLGTDVSAPVVDNTGVEGNYTLFVRQMRHWEFDQEVQDSLAHYGLKLVPGKYPVEMLVIDKITMQIKNQ